MSQGTSVTGRTKYRSSEIDKINAKTPYLMSLYAARQRQGFQQRAELREQEKLKLEEERAEEDKKQAKVANILGITKGVVSLGTGLKNSGILSAGKNLYNDIFGESSKEEEQPVADVPEQDADMPEDTRAEGFDYDRPDSNIGYSLYPDNYSISGGFGESGGSDSGSSGGGGQISFDFG